MKMVRELYKLAECDIRLLAVFANLDQSLRVLTLCFSVS